MRKLFIVVAFAGALLFDARPAAAYTNIVELARWCAVINLGRDAYWDCHYSSIEECRPTILAGNRGFCNPNPYWIGRYGPPERPRRAIRRY
jgi:Protein of unknown function (DUF3551)